ncbi:hypothetical protein SBA4_3430009 [Candidatus Sulfopaludibacter sp. SbA4]|nr:hypothetical protein SBA4_3430009 [Candidatus Sulfopaludibacter sp. SbA4]
MPQNFGPDRAEIARSFIWKGRGAKDVAATAGSRGGAVRKVAGRDLRRPQVFDLPEPEVHQPGAELLRFKISGEGLAQPGYMLGTPLMHGAHFGRQRRRRVAVVEHHVGAIRQARDEAERGPYGFLCQVRHHSKPSEEGLLRRIEAGGTETAGQSLAFEIDRCKSQPGWQGDGSLGKALAFPCLRSGMVDFKNGQAAAEWAAIRICVQPGAEHHELTDTALDRGGQGILREARARRDENSHPASGRALLGLTDDGIGVNAQDPQGKRIGEDAALFQHLVRGAVKRCGASRAAGLPEMHTSRVYAGWQAKAPAPPSRFIEIDWAHEGRYLGSFYAANPFSH